MMFTKMNRFSQQFTIGILSKFRNNKNNKMSQRKCSTGEKTEDAKVGSLFAFCMLTGLSGGILGGGIGTIVTPVHEKKNDWLEDYMTVMSGFLSYGILGTVLGFLSPVTVPIGLIVFVRRYYHSYVVADSNKEKEK